MNQPAMPYEVKDCQTLTGTRPAKVKPNDAGIHPWLSDDEIAVWEYVRYLEGENARLRVEVVAALAAPAVASETKPGKGKKSQ